MKLTIAPLSTPGAISISAREAILCAKKLFIQTKSHPSAFWLDECGVQYESMDDLYEASYDFDELNEAIAERLFSADEDAVFAPVGRGAGSALMDAIRARAAKSGDTFTVLCASGYAEAALCAAMQPFSFADARVLCANALPCHLDPSVPLCIEEIDTPIRAGEVKLALSEYYPDEHEVIFAHMDGRGNYVCAPIPLYEADRQKDYFAATVLIVPPVSLEQRERHGVYDLCDVVARLRGANGCPWDKEQTHESLRNTMIEEAYEAVDAIERDDMDALCEELGDVLLQIVFHSQIEAEAHGFTLRDVSSGIVKKLIYRHPHVFANLAVSGTEEVLKNWEELKRKEKHQQTGMDAISAVPKNFPALLRASKVQKRAAAAAAYDAQSTGEVLSIICALAVKIELAEANTAAEKAAQYDQVGDMLFAMACLARIMHIDAELALKDSTRRFEQAFAKMEQLSLQNGAKMNELSQKELALLWQWAKQE